MDFRKPKTVANAERRRSSFSVLYHFRKMVEYAMVLIASKPMPSYMKHALSQMITPEVGEIGGHLQWANKMSEINHTKREAVYPKEIIVGEAQEARRLFHLKLKFSLEFLRDQRWVEEHQKDHLDSLIGEFERTLDGWTKYQSSYGVR